MLELYPGLSVAGLDAFAEFFNSADLRADYIEGLRKAEMEEPGGKYK